MSDDQKPKRPKTGGRGPRAGAAASKSLAPVRTDEELEAYTAAAAAAGQNRSDWIRDTLSRAAQQVLRSRG